MSFFLGLLKFYGIMILLGPQTYKPTRQSERLNESDPPKIHLDLLHNCAAIGETGLTGATDQLVVLAKLVMLVQLVQPFSLDSFLSDKKYFLEIFLIFCRQPVFIVPEPMLELGQKVVLVGLSFVRIE